MINEDDMEGASQNESAVGDENNYKIWKKNAPFLYDILITWGLDWPSLCVHWLPNVDHFMNNYLTVQKMVIGTYTSGQENDYLMIAKTRLPTHPRLHSKDVSDSSNNLNNNITTNNNNINTNSNNIINDYFINSYNNQEAINSFCKIENKIEIETKIRHEGEVNKAKAMPQENKFNIIATKTNKGEVHIFDYFKHPPKPVDDTPCPNKRLKGHTDIGYGLSWSYFKEGLLLSGGYDHLVNLYDIEGSTGDPLHTFSVHEMQCEDVCFSKKNENIFASCGDDKKIFLYDFRSKDVVAEIIGHDAEINSIDFNPINEFLYLTGSSDKTVALWDIRKPELKMHEFIHHKDSVINVKWNPKRGNVLMSSGDDNKILIWDLTLIGSTIGREDNEEAPSELIFEHGGHMDRINDIDWNSKEDMMCASVDSVNNLHIWELNVNNLMK